MDPRRQRFLVDKYLRRWARAHRDPPHTQTPFGALADPATGRPRVTAVLDGVAYRLINREWFMSRDGATFHPLRISLGLRPIDQLIQRAPLGFWFKEDLGLAIPTVYLQFG